MKNCTVSYDLLVSGQVRPYLLEQVDMQDNLFKKQLLPVFLQQLASTGDRDCLELIQVPAVTERTA